MVWDEASGPVRDGVCERWPEASSTASLQRYGHFPPYPGGITVVHTSSQVFTNNDKHHVNDLMTLQSLYACHSSQSAAMKPLKPKAAGCPKFDLCVAVLG